MAIRLAGPPRSTVAEDLGAARTILDRMGQREQLRQDRQSVNDFITENIRLSGINETLPPEVQLSPDEVSQRAAANITNKGAQFDKGIAGGFQRFAGGLSPGPSTALTGPVAKGLLEQPTGIRRDLIKAQIEASQARTQQKTGQPDEFTPGQKQRDKLIKVADSDKSEQGLARKEAIKKMSTLPREDLFDLSDSDSTNVDTKFRSTMKTLGNLKIKVPGAKFDKMFGEEAFNQGLKNLIEEGLSQGTSSESVEAEFLKWWDFEAAKKDPAGFGREFQLRSEFDISALIEKALSEGKISKEEAGSATRILKSDPTKAKDIQEALGI